MPALWEHIPIVGPVLGGLANGIENGVKGGAGMAGGFLNAGADITIGKERKERILTEAPTWLVDNVGDKNKILHSAKELVHNADEISLAELVGEVLRRSPDLIAPRLLLETSKRIISKISEKVNERADSVRELAGEVLQGALKLITPALDLINPLSILEAVSKVLSGISSEIERPVTRQVDEVIQGSLNLISSAAELVCPELLLKTLVKLARTVLTAVLAKVGQLDIIQGGIFSNDINAATLGLVWNNVDKLASFFVDLAECAKCYASAISLDGKDGQNSPHGQENEFDFSQAMNRHAITCQVQRLAISIIFILKRMATPTRFDEINMTSETTLKSDDLGSGAVLEVTPSGWQQVVDPGPAGPWVRLPTSPGTEPEQPSAGEQPKEKPHEKWLFVNGIATELFWLHLACKKLAKRYSREVTGVFNRGDGILWDLIECAGERDASGKGCAESQKQLIQRTMSSKMAQESLKKQLKAALEEARDGNKYAHVVMIAHSQGCLLLRLALEELVNADPDGTDNIRKTMLDRLCVFTFGSPSVDWKRDSKTSIQPLKKSKQELENLDLTYLSLHVLRTEHFANEVDFVAKLGVLSKYKEANSGYARECVFVNKERDWIGHLFGTQYSLDSNHYKDEKAGDHDEVTGDKSWLLACENGVSIRDARTRVRV